MWYRSWVETRWRMVLMLLVNAFIASVLLDDAVSANVWRQRFGNVLPMIFAMNGIVLAGSGVASQVSQKPGQAVHTSMLFLLSLPVTRRRMVLVRQAVGAFATVFVVLATLAAFVIAAPEVRAMIAPGMAMAYVTCVLLVVLTAYAVSALLATVLDQLWQTYAAMGVVGAILGGVPQARVWRAFIEAAPAGGTSDVMSHAMVIVSTAIICIAVSSMLSTLAVRVVNRKQF